MPCTTPRVAMMRSSCAYSLRLRAASSESPGCACSLRSHSVTRTRSASRARARAIRRAVHVKRKGRSLRLHPLGNKPITAQVQTYKQNHKMKTEEYSLELWLLCCNREHVPESHLFLGDVTKE
ncbi:Protein of unknown function [Gryllus bimaculatus]|nr:Protein of unknown function [Gryllus bimaculatus]